MLAVSLFVVGIIMWWFERTANAEQFGGREHTPLAKQLWHGVYLSFAGFTSKTEEFGPRSVPGRLLGLCNAFAIWLVRTPTTRVPWCTFRPFTEKVGTDRAHPAVNAQVISFYIANLASIFTATKKSSQAGSSSPAAREP